MLNSWNDIPSLFRFASIVAATIWVFEFLEAWKTQLKRGVISVACAKPGCPYSFLDRSSRSSCQYDCCIWHFDSGCKRGRVHCLKLVWFWVRLSIPFRNPVFQVITSLVDFSICKLEDRISLLRPAENPAGLRWNQRTRKLAEDMSYWISEKIHVASESLAFILWIVFF